VHKYFVVIVHHCTYISRTPKRIRKSIGRGVLPATELKKLYASAPSFHKPNLRMHTHTHPDVGPYVLGTGAILRHLFFTSPNLTKKIRTVSVPQIMIFISLCMCLHVINACVSQNVSIPLTLNSVHSLSVLTSATRFLVPTEWETDLL